MTPSPNLPPFNAVLPIRNLVSNLPTTVFQVYYRDLGTYGSFLALEYETFFYALWSPEKTCPPTREHIQRMLRRGWALPPPMAFQLFGRSTFGKPYAVLPMEGDLEHPPHPSDMHTSPKPTTGPRAEPVD